MVTNLQACITLENSMKKILIQEIIRIENIPVEYLFHLFKWELDILMLFCKRFYPHMEAFIENLLNVTITPFIEGLNPQD